MTEVDGILVAAHELKTPLTTLRQLALSLDDLDSANAQIRDDMVQVSEYALRQVNDLIKLRYLEDGSFKMEPIAVREVCNAVTSELSDIYSGSRQKLATHYHNRARLVSANRELLYSIIYNFTTSALHYAEQESDVELSIGETKNHVRILIRDFGPGLPAKTWRELKTGFLTQPTPVAMRPGSSSLGLYIASRFSRYMHANVGAVRHRDGASFYVELPISKQASLFI